MEKQQLFLHRSLGTPRRFHDHLVLDCEGRQIGYVADVVYDRDGAAEFLVVDPGPLRAARYVPVVGAYVTVTGEIVVPWEIATVRRAPQARVPHVVAGALRDGLEQHYRD